MRQLYSSSQLEMLKCGENKLLLRIDEVWDYLHSAGEKTEVLGVSDVE